MSITLEEFKAKIDAFEARIAALETLKASAWTTASANVSPDLLSDNFKDEIQRPYESEIGQLRYKVNVAKIDFATSQL